VRHRACSASSAVDNRRHVGSDSKDCIVVITGYFAIGHYNIIIKLLKLAYFTPLTSVTTQSRHLLRFLQLINLCMVYSKSEGASDMRSRANNIINIGSFDESETIWSRTGLAPFLGTGSSDIFQVTQLR
jgi:hypothetical protein